MTSALRLSDPENGEVYQRNHDAFVEEISTLERELAAIFKAFQGKKILVFHPAWSYFCRDFGLIQIPIQREGKDPSPGDLTRLIETSRNESIRVIFVQRQFDTHQAETIAREIGATVVTLDPLAEDWFKNMRRIADTFAKTFAREK